MEAALDRKSTRLNSSHLGISYAVFCLKKEILFQFPLVAVIKQVHPRINVPGFDPGILGNAPKPLGRILADEIVADPPEFFTGLKGRIGPGSFQLEPKDRWGWRIRCR